MLLHPGPAALHRASSAAGMPLSPGEVPWAWGRPVTVSSATLSPKEAPHYSPAMHSSGHIVCEGCYPLENSPPTGNTRLQTRGAPFPPSEWGLPSSDTPSLPPTHSQPMWGVHSLPRGTSPTTHPCVRASFPSTHKHCGIHGEILPSSGQSSILYGTAAQKHRCHLCHCSPSTPYKCWLPLGVAVHTSTALLPAQVLTYAFRGSPAPLKKPWTLLLSLQCLWVLKNRY